MFYLEIKKQLYLEKRGDVGTGKWEEIAKPLQFSLSHIAGAVEFEGDELYK